MTSADRKALVTALRAICAIAPACSVESQGVECDCGRGCGWRDKLRDAQRIARLQLAALGEDEG